MGVAKGIGCDIALIFRQQNLARVHERLAQGCHLYLVCRRPKTYIDRTSVRFSRGRVRGRLVVETPSKQAVSHFRTPFVIDPGERLRWKSGGTTDYYQLVGERSGQRYLEGDTWAFAFLASHCRRDLAEQEVLYVGRAFGESGERTALDRILTHSTIQRIYADHQCTTFDVFICFLRVTSAGSLAMLHSRESFAAVDRADLSSLVMSTFRPAHERLREQVWLAEAALISYFQPTYNLQNKSFPEGDSKLVSDLDARGFTNLEVQLSDGGTGLRLWSSGCPPNRHHRFTCFLPSVAKSVGGYLAVAATEMEERLQSAAQIVATAVACGEIIFAFLPVEPSERLNKI